MNKFDRSITQLFIGLTLCTSFYTCGSASTKPTNSAGDTVITTIDSTKPLLPVTDNSAQPTADTLSRVVSPPPGKQAQWTLFWKNFKDAIGAKDKKRIAAISAPDFFDGGGGGTVEEWLDAEVFRNDQVFRSFQQLLQKGAKMFRGEGEDYRATGKNHSGDLFFQYKKDKWEFGGVVGD